MGRTLFEYPSPYFISRYEETIMNQKSVTILLAEDDHDDRYLISEALDESGVESQLFIVENGEDLLNYLKGKEKYADRDKFPLPSLILLDLNMPLMDGREALAEIKKDASLRRIPIVVLTTSQAEDDVEDTYGLGITGFITKPMRLKTPMRDNRLWAKKALLFWAKREAHWLSPKPSPSMNAMYLTGCIQMTSCGTKTPAPLKMTGIG